jgi:DNA-binding CsgD family transcriptional regulator
MPAIEGMQADAAAPRPAAGARPAGALVSEAEAVTMATGHRLALSTALMLAAWRGRELRALELVGALVDDGPAAGEDRAIALSDHARAILYNGLGRYSAALAAAQRACADADPVASIRALGELVEAATRTGERDIAAAAVRRLREGTRVPTAGWRRGILLQSTALVHDGAGAALLFDHALDRLRTGGTPLQLARAALLYGEWLRRDGRRVAAREQLRAAHAVFDRLGVEGFADRARRELLATGAVVRKRSVETRDDLTAQEAEVARLAADGHTNPEIGARLYLSPRTVEWHLRKVFRKLGVSSRRELRMAVRDGADVALQPQIARIGPTLSLS